MRKRIEKLREYCIVKQPFFARILLKVRIIDGSVPNGYAGTDGIHIILDKKFWELSSGEKVGTILHEIMHIALKHVRSAREKKYKGTWNIACDCVVNEFLRSFNIQLPKGVIYAKDISKMIHCPEEEIRKMSAEEIYYRLLRAGCREEKTVEFVGSGEVEEADIDIRDVVEAYEMAKMIGTLPGYMDILLEKLVKGKVNWRELLRHHLMSCFGVQVQSTWRRIHRRLPYVVPGYIRFGIEQYLRKIYVLLDISGSIVYEPNVLEQFFSEVVEIARVVNAKVTVATWDTEVKEVFEVRSPRDVLERKYVGGGGTNITEALQWSLRQRKRWEKSAVVVLTDGCLVCDDTGLPYLVARSFDKAIYVYTIEENQDLFPNWIRIKIS